MVKPKGTSKSSSGGRTSKNPSTIAPLALHGLSPAPRGPYDPVPYEDLILNPTGNQDWVGGPVYAKNRSELSEALPYFRIPEGSTYIEDDIVRGFLLDDDDSALSPRQGYMDAEVIITKIPPALPWKTNFLGTVHSKTRRRAQAAVQNQLLAFSNNQAYGHPLVLILDRKWRDSIFDDNTEGEALLTRYVVLDHFLVTALWSEPSRVQGESDLRMVRFEKLHINVPSWWVFPAHVPPLNRTFNDSNQQHDQVCKQCGFTSFQVYAEDWFCHNELCVHFGCNQQGDFVADRDLTYSPEYLKARVNRSNYQGFAPRYDLKPNLLQLVDEDKQLALSGNRVNRASALLGLALVCAAPNCNQVCPRIFWHCWFCERCGFKFNIGPTPELYHRWAFMQPFGIAPNGHPAIQIQCPDDYRIQATQIRPSYRMDRIFLHGDAFITLITPTEEFNQGRHGPDEIFNALLKLAPTGDLPLRRRRMYPYDRYSGRRTPYFVAMYGQQYDFSKFNSIPQDETPESLLSAESLMVNACEEEIPKHYTDKFNQASLECYFDDMLMPWHTEGDREVGSTISLLSLGSNAKLRVRLKQKVYENSNLAKVIRGSYNWRNLQQVKRLVQVGMDLDAAWSCMDFYQGPPQPPEVVLPLLHGSVVIFQGKHYSKYFEHIIENTDNASGTLRFTVTARSIDPAKHAQVKLRHPFSRQCGPKFSLPRLQITQQDVDEDNDDESSEFDDDSDDSDDDDYNDYSTSGSFDPKWPGKLPRPVARKSIGGSFVPVEEEDSGRAELAIRQTTGRQGRPMRSYAEVDDSDSDDNTPDPLIEKRRAAAAKKTEERQSRRSRDRNANRDRSRSPAPDTGRGGGGLRDRNPPRGTRSAPTSDIPDDSDDDNDADAGGNNSSQLAKLKAGKLDPANGRILAKKQPRQQPAAPAGTRGRGSGRVGGSQPGRKNHRWTPEENEALKQAGLRVSKGQSTWTDEMDSLPDGITKSNAKERYFKMFKKNESTGDGNGGSGRKRGKPPGNGRGGGGGDDGGGPSGGGGGDGGDGGGAAGPSGYGSWLQPPAPPSGFGLR